MDLPVTGHAVSVVASELAEQTSMQASARSLCAWR